MSKFDQFDLLSLATLISSEYHVTLYGASFKLNLKGVTKPPTDLDSEVKLIMDKEQRVELVSCTTKSGREFVYNFRDFPFGPHTTLYEAESLARRIVWERYRESEWDRAHADIDSQKEILESVRAFVLGLLGDMKRVWKK